MFVLLSSHELRRKPVNLFISHQSFVDFWALVLTLLINTVKNMSDHPDGWFKTLLCKMFYSNSIMWSVIHVSGYNLTFLTLERYWAVKVRYRAVKVRYWVVKVRYWAVKVRYWAVKVRYWAVKVRYWAVKVIYWAVKVRYWAVKVRYWAVKVRYWAVKVRY